MNSRIIKAWHEVLVKMVVKKICGKTNWGPNYLLFTSKRSKELNEIGSYLYLENVNYIQSKLFSFFLFLGFYRCVDFNNIFHVTTRFSVVKKKSKFVPVTHHCLDIS